MTNPNRMMAAPTIKIVIVWPTPQRTPIHPARESVFSRLIIVDTATTWSGSVACRMPRKNPMPRISKALVIARRHHNSYPFPFVQLEGQFPKLSLRTVVFTPLIRVVFPLRAHLRREVRPEPVATIRGSQIEVCTRRLLL